VSLFSVFKRIYTLLETEAPDVDWALTGSLAFYLRGINVLAQDIDIQSDDTGAYAIGALLQNQCFECLEPVRFDYAPPGFSRGEHSQ